MKDKLVIFGDSWPCGEWGNPDPATEEYGVTHPGITAYLSERFKVQNLAAGGSSLWKILRRIEDYLTIDDGIDRTNGKFIVFQTSPLRSGLGLESSVDYKSIAERHSSVVEFGNEIIEIWYVRLDEIARRIRSKILIVGGFSDVDINTIGLYENLEVLCPSWQKLLFPEHIDSTIPLRGEKYALEFFREINNPALLDSYLDYIDQQTGHYLNMMDLDTFGPVDFHPNREGHKIMSDRIIEFLTKP